MPWHVEKRDDEWCVIKDDDGEVEGCHDSEEEAEEQRKALYAQEPDAAAETVEAAVIDPVAPMTTAGTGGRRYRGVLAIQGSTDDGRVFENLKWRELPLSMLTQLSTPGMSPHEGAQVAARIEWIEQRGRVVLFGGTYNDDEVGQYAADRAEDQSLVGVSMDAVGLAEVRCTEIEDDPDWGPTCASYAMVFPEATICAATQLATPAFAAARLEIVPDMESEEEAAAALDRIVARATELIPPDPTFVEMPPSPFDILFASAGAPSQVHPPLEPPAAWFNEPEPDHLVPLHITADGQVYGHIAAWGTCHTGYEGVCITAPPSPSDYEFYNLKAVVCDDGTQVMTGPITIGTGHADAHHDARGAMAHYDNTGHAVADVVMRHGVHGPWACGAARPTITPEQVREFNASGPSGDWRSLRGELDLVAVLMVNTQGFPLVASGVSVKRGGAIEQHSLVAALPAKLNVSGSVADTLRAMRAEIDGLRRRMDRVELTAEAAFAESEDRIFARLQATIEQE
jgi:hypothetical protein